MLGPSDKIFPPLLTIFPGNQIEDSIGRQIGHVLKIFLDERKRKISKTIQREIKKTVKVIVNCENVKIAQFNDFLKINFAIKYVIIYRKRDFLLKHALARYL